MGSRIVYLVGWEAPLPPLPGVAFSVVELESVRAGEVPPWATVVLPDGACRDRPGAAMLELLRTRRLLPILVRAEGAVGETPGCRPSPAVRVCATDELAAELGASRTLAAVRRCLDPSDWLPGRVWSSRRAAEMLRAADRLAQVPFPVGVAALVCAVYDLGILGDVAPDLLRTKERAFLRLAHATSGMTGERLVLRYVTAFSRAGEAAGFSGKVVCAFAHISGPSSLARTRRRSSVPQDRA